MNQSIQPIDQTHGLHKGWEHHSPVPEPAVHGLVLLTLALAFILVYRWKFRR